MAPVAHAVRALSVVAPGDLANPVGGIARHRGYGGCCHAASQQSEEVPVAALDRIIGSTIARVEFIVGEVGFEVDASWHAHVLQLHAATSYEIKIDVRR